MPADLLEDAAAVRATSLGGFCQLRFDHHLFSSGSSEQESFDINRSNQDHEMGRLDAQTNEAGRVILDFNEEMAE